MLSTKHAHRPECSLSHVNMTFFNSTRRYEHRSSIEEMIIFLFLSLSDILIHAETLSVSQPAPSPNIPTSSLSVVDADMSHLEALPYMCCIDISLLTFPFPGGLIVKLL